MQPGFPGPFILAGNFVQTIIKVPRISEDFCRLCQARSPTGEIAQIAARAPICPCIPLWWSSKPQPLCVALGGGGALGTV